MLNKPKNKDDKTLQTNLTYATRATAATANPATAKPESTSLLAWPVYGLAEVEPVAGALLPAGDGGGGAGGMFVPVAGAV